jgi:hydroxypyruvate isomerase
MPRFAANLSMLWPDLDVYDRFRAAAEAGFHTVEILFVHALDHDRIANSLKEYGLELVLFDPNPGNWEAGERGLLSLPGREADFMASIQDAVKTAQRFGTRRLNAICGVLPPGVNHDDAERAAIANLRAAAPVAEAEGVLLLIENINTTDMPGYFAPTAEKAAALVEAADHPSVRLQLDQYHVGMMGGDPVSTFRDYAPLVEHVQIADVPGRHEPGTGHQPIEIFLHELDTLGYAGAVGLEYRPSGLSTEAALEWLPRQRRG